MSDQPTPPSDPTFQARLEAVEGYHGLTEIPPPVNPLQAQTAFERRAWLEDIVAHLIGIIQTSGFFMLAFAVLLGFVNISNAATATMVGTILGYAVGKVDPVLTRYFSARIRLVRPQQPPPANGASEPSPPAATPAPSAS